MQTFLYVELARKFNAIWNAELNPISCIIVIDKKNYMEV